MLIHLVIKQRTLETKAAAGEHLQVLWGLRARAHKYQGHGSPSSVPLGYNNLKKICKYEIEFTIQRRNIINTHLNIHDF